jgi:acyl-CoA synthetase (NDP forming)
MVVEPEALDPFFHPKSIAIVGVSRTNLELGGTSFLNRLRQAGYCGALYPINPKMDTVSGIRAYPDLTSLPELPDLVMVCLAAGRVPSVLDECARIGVRHIHILTSGFRELGTEEGEALENRIASIAREKGLLVIGPNCMGPYCPSSHLTPWGAIPGLPGPIGIISQSGTITQRLAELMCSLGIGVEKAVSIGNAAVLSNPDYLAYMARDKKIKVIAMYVEGLRDGKSLFDLTRKVTQIKPVIIWKGGESDVGASTISSHTGKMAGQRHIWEAFFRQTGAVQVQSVEEWMDALVAFCLLPSAIGKEVFLIGGGGGSSVVNSDSFIRGGFNVPRLSDATMERLCQIIPAAGSIAGNPLDQFRTFQDTAHLTEILELGFRDPACSMIVVDRLIPRIAYHLPDLPDSTPELIAYLTRKQQEKPVIMAVESEGGDEDLAAEGAAIRGRFCKAGIPAFPSINRAVRALRHLSRYQEKPLNLERRNFK